MDKEKDALCRVETEDGQGERRAVQGIWGSRDWEA